MIFRRFGALRVWPKRKERMADVCACALCYNSNLFLVGQQELKSTGRIRLELAAIATRSRGVGGW